MSRNICETCGGAIKLAVCFCTTKPSPAANPPTCLALIARIRELEARKCSHGDYRMLGTDDCKNWDKCGGRTEIYVIGEGLCISCRLAAEKGGAE